MLVYFIVLALLIAFALMRPKGINIWFVKLLIQLIIGGGGIVYFITDVQHWHEHDYGLLHILLYIIFWFAVFLASALWRMVDMSSDEIRNDVHHAMKMAKKCRYCLKKLPSYSTSKCPHCTADL